ncbi:hypothetical protein [Helcococcus ovis]|uniref:hypothetical protein n=2 Tax=Helcococcus ovis TaxID=72026 RepID=UPI00106F82A0|nr:hypothetical protein [Helcococcus ovis]TFF65818.1 hypothetical protein EQF93_07945 [Helcococcus ovis]WNZ00752.1 hypothetical protein EQF90_005685 [Helcococcus ovis]
MKKHKLILFIFLSLIFVSCGNNDVKEINTKNIKDTEIKKIEKKSLFAEGTLKDKQYSNIVAMIDYMDDNSYKLKIRIEQKDDITFNTENQNVYADINISSDSLNNGEIKYKKNIDDKSLFKIPLVNNRIPRVTEILIDKNSDLLTKKEHKAILEKEKGLWISIQIRDPQGFILEISNTIFGEKQ